MMEEYEGHDNPVFSKENDHIAISVNENLTNAITYSWSKVNAYVLPEKGPFKGKHQLKEEKQILKEVTGICRPGELVAIMGASGAGKTTLLNVLTSRSGNNVRIEGDLFVNGERMSLNDLTKRSAYVQQDDLFIGTMTVKEQLIFQANLRMDHHIPRKKRMERVQEVLREIGLVNCKDTLIGEPGRIKGISGGETKRLAFACEVLTNPQLMFCDEPTSGLDSFMAQNIVSVMKDLAGQGKAVISTIHQPSSEVFAMFDRVLLIAEGRLAYLGHTSNALKFFSSLGRTCPHNFNPADYFISTLAIRPEYEDECREYVNVVCDSFRDSSEMIDIARAVQDNMNENGTVLVKDQKKESPYKTGWIAQLNSLNKRSFLEMAREPMLLRIKIIQTIMIALMVGLIYLDTSGTYDQASVQNINGCLFILVTNLSFQFCFGVVSTFCSQLPIFIREHWNGMYRTDVFYFTKNFAEFPGSVLLPFLFLGVCYFMVNFYRDVNTFFIIFAVLALVSNAALSYGYLVSCLASNLRMALAILAPMLIPFMLFGGFFLNADTVPAYFIWMQYISWFNYGNEAVIIAQWKNVETIDCNDLIFCYRNGTDVIHSLGYSEDNLWIDFTALVALILFYRTLAFFALLRRSYKGL